MQRLICLAAFTVLIQSWPAFAQNGADQVIAVPEVEVRSRPSMQSYPTRKLHSGDKVRVVNTKNEGWLGILPPPRSFSWINARHMTNPDNKTFTAAVAVPGAEILIGSELVKEMPSQIGSTLPQGTILTLLTDQRADGRVEAMPLTGPNGVYYAIAPTGEELRWIPASAVQPQSAATSSSASAINTGSTASGTSDAALMVRAERSAAAANVADALACYNQLAQQTTDPNVRAWASERYQSLQYRPTASANVQSNYSQNGSGWNNPGAAATTASNLNVRPDYRHTGPGRLDRSFLTVAGGSKLWVLTPDDSHQARTYVKAGPSISLDDYVNRHVDVYGIYTYDGELRNYYLEASKVDQLGR